MFGRFAATPGPETTSKTPQREWRNIAKHKHKLTLGPCLLELMKYNWRQLREWVLEFSESSILLIHSKVVLESGEGMTNTLYTLAMSP